MSLTMTLRSQNLTLTAVEEARVRRQFRGLERRLIHFPDPVAEISLTELSGPRRVEVDLRVKLGSLGAHLVSHQTDETLHRAVRRAISDAERELERQLAKQRGEPSFGIPSRRRTAPRLPSHSTETAPEMPAPD